VSVIVTILTFLSLGGHSIAGNLSRPNAPMTGISPQKSALPTAPSKQSGQVGGATTPNQRAVGSVGGPSVNATAHRPAIKSDNVQPASSTAVNTAVNTAVMQK